MMQLSPSALLPGDVAGTQDSSNLVRWELVEHTQRSTTGSGSTLVRKIEANLLDEHLMQARQRQLELTEEIIRKLERLNESLDHMVQERERQRATLPPHLGALAYLERAAQFNKTRIAQLLGVTRQSIHNWETGGSIAATKRAHLLAVRDVIEQAALHHTTPEDLAAWLDTPRGADGRTPAQLLAARSFDRARLLATATPAPAMQRPAAEWANRPVPPAFERGAEQLPLAEPPEPRDLESQLDDEPDEYAAIITVEGL